MFTRVFSAATYVPTPTADTTNLANGTYQTIGAASATAGVDIVEIWVNGQAAATDVKLMMFAKDSQLGGTVTAVAAPNSDGPMNPGTGATPVAQPIVYTAITSGNNPQRSVLATSARLNLTINAFGGIAKYQANQWEGWEIAGTTASVSESSLSAYTFAGSSTGAISSMIKYETF